MLTVGRAVYVVRAVADGHAFHLFEGGGVNDVDGRSATDADINAPAIRGNGDVVGALADGHAADDVERAAIHDVQHVFGFAADVESLPVGRGHDAVRVSGHAKIARDTVSRWVDDSNVVARAISHVNANRSRSQGQHGKQGQPFHWGPRYTMRAGTSMLGMSETGFANWPPVVIQRSSGIRATSVMRQGLALWAVGWGLAALTGAETIRFDSVRPGSLPADWTVAMTHTGAAPKWEVRND